MLTALFNEFKSSIKAPDTEEKLDLLLYRPIGFLMAKIANFLGMTPSMLSIMGLFFGILSGYYFVESKSNSSFIIASGLLIFSGILDSADGQLARISNQSTKIGLILDGICDSLVMIAVYTACSWPYIVNYGAYYIFVVFVSLYFHSCQCAILDFYHREYLYFGYGKTFNDIYWNPNVSEGLQNIYNSSNRLEKIMNMLRLSWLKNQQMMTSRTDDQRMRMRKIILKSKTEEKEIFMTAYRKNNLWTLPFWRLVGVNAHTILILLFMFFKRFDIYLVMFDIVLLNFIILIMSLIQKNADRKFLKEIEFVTYGE